MTPLSPDQPAAISEVPIVGASIALGALLKWAGAASTGGEAKQLIQDGLVHVNGVTELRRRRQIFPGDTVSIRSRETFRVSGGGSPS